MSTSKVIEYRLVWPNGHLYSGPFGTMSGAGVDRQDIATHLRTLGVPDEYVPVIQARVLKTEASEWTSPSQADIWFQIDADEDYVPHSGIYPTEEDDPDL